MLGARMFDLVESLVLDLLEWVGPEPRPYDEVLDAWRTSCPRLPVWEDAKVAGLVVCMNDVEGQSVVSVTPKGWQFLLEHRPPAISGTTAGLVGVSPYTGSEA